MSIARKLGRHFRRAVLAAAFCTLLALTAVLAGWSDIKPAKFAPVPSVPFAPPANESSQQYAGNMDMSVIFQAR